MARQVRSGGRRAPWPRYRPEAEGLEQRRLLAAGVVLDLEAPTNDAAPATIAVDADGNAWFTEPGSGAIGMAGTDGQIAEYAVPGLVGTLGGIAAAGEGSQAVLISGGIAQAPAGHANAFQNLSTGAWFTEPDASRIGWITGGGLITEFNLPDAGARPGPVVADGQGGAWFGATGAGSAGEIGLIEPGGAIWEFPLPTGAQASALAEGPDGNVWFVDGPQNAIGRMTPAGVVTLFSIPTAASGAAGITAGADGNLWFTESAANQVGRITPSGTITEFALAAAAPAANPGAISAGPDGMLWFTATTAAGAALGRIGPADGSATLFPLPADFVAPAAIVASAEGLWFADPQANRVGLFGIDTAAGFETYQTQPGTVVGFAGVVPDNTPLATFSTTLGHTSAADFTATVDWGDGTTSAAPVNTPSGLLSNSGLPTLVNNMEPIAPGSLTDFEVDGGHTYAQAGTYTVAVTITDQFGDSTTVTETATIAAGALVLVPQAVSPPPIVAGSDDANPLTVGLLYQADGNVPSGASVTIDWGDGSTSAGSIDGADGGSTDSVSDVAADPSAWQNSVPVDGSHVYAQPGNYTITVTVTAGSQTITATTTAQVVGETINVGSPWGEITAGDPLPDGGAVITSFFDSRPDAGAGDFTATIDWGDGTTSTGTITAESDNPGGFDVSGQHAYAHAGQYPVTVTVSRTDGSASAFGTGTFQVDDPAQFSASVNTWYTGAPAGQAFTIDVGGLSSPNPQATASDYTATIDWGDGTSPTAGVITADGAGMTPVSFTISGGHTYAQDGTYVVRVTIVQADGKTASFLGQLTVGKNPFPFPILDGAGGGKGPVPFGPSPTPAPKTPHTPPKHTHPVKPKSVMTPRAMEYMLTLNRILARAQSHHKAATGHGHHRRVDPPPHPKHPAHSGKKTAAHPAGPLRVHRRP